MKKRKSDEVNLYRLLKNMKIQQSKLLFLKIKYNLLLKYKLYFFFKKKKEKKNNKIIFKKKKK